MEKFYAIHESIILNGFHTWIDHKRSTENHQEIYFLNQKEMMKIYDEFCLSEDYEVIPYSDLEKFVHCLVVHKLNVIAKK